MKQNISILGLGWLGAPLAQELVKAGYQVLGSTRSALSGGSLNRIRHFVIDISNPKQSYQNFLDSETLIIAIPSRDLEGYQRLITQIETSQVKQVLLVSTTSVYPLTNGIVNEESATKVSIRVDIEDLFTTNRSFDTTVLRFAGLFGGERQPGNFFKPGRIIDHPEGYVNLIHRDDCIGIILAILKQNIWGQVLNACVDDHPTRRAFYTWAAAQVGRTDLSFNEQAENHYKIVSSQKLQALLGYQFKYAKLMEG